MYSVAVAAGLDSAVRFMFFALDLRITSRETAPWRGSSAMFLR